MCKQGEMKEEFINYFGTIMKEYRADRSQHITKITMHIPTLVTPCQIEILNKPVELREVEEAMFRMADGKALGPDGFTANFFHHFWDVIKVDVWKIVEDSRQYIGVLWPSIQPF